MGPGTKLPIRLMVLALALTGMGQMSLAQSAQAPDTSLRAQYPQMVQMSGKVLVFGPEADTNAVAARWGRFVLYAPLNRLWLVDDAGAVFEHAYIEVKQKPFDHLLLHWTHWSDVDISDILPAAAQIPVLTVLNNTPHPLAAAYDALLAKPLVRATGPLPAGAYFSAGGHVFDQSGAQIAEWNSYGPRIALRMRPAGKNTTANPDPAAKPLWQWLAVADLAAALNQEQPQGEN